MFFFTGNVDPGYQSGSDKYIHQETEFDKFLKDRSEDEQAQYRDEQEKESILETGMYERSVKFLYHVSILIKKRLSLSL